MQKHFLIKYEIFRKKKKIPITSSKKFFLSYIFKNLQTWGAQGKMTQLNLFVNSMPRDLAEFVFFMIVGFTAGTLGIV